jgi:maltose O-acetyltransferase
MATINYLWKHRAKYPINTIQFYRAWAKRLLCLSELKKRNRRRSRFVSKGAIIDERAEIGEVNILGEKSYLKIGAFSFLGKVHIALHDQVIIGDNVCINDGVQILTASHDVSDSQWKEQKAKIVIDDFVWIATNAIILPGVHIGYGSVIGAGAVVSKDVAANSIVVGNPAKPILKRRVDELNYNPCEFLASNNAWLKG